MLSFQTALQYLSKPQLNSYPRVSIAMRRNYESRVAIMQEISFFLARIEYASPSLFPTLECME